MNKFLIARIDSKEGAILMMSSFNTEKTANNQAKKLYAAYRGTYEICVYKAIRTLKKAPIPAPTFTELT